MTHDEIEVKLNAAEEYNAHSEFANAEEAAREIIGQLAKHKKSGGEELHIRALLILSESLSRRGLSNEALPIAQQALTLVIDLNGSGRTELEARVRGNIGTVYGWLSEYAKAIEYHEQALALFDQLNNKQGIANTTCNIGLVYWFLGEYSKVLEFFGRSIMLHNELGNKQGVANLSGNMGSACLSLSKYAEAIEYYEKAIRLFEELGDKSGAAIDTGNIGNVYFALSEYSKALEYYEKARILFEELNDKQGLARNIDSIGSIYSILKNYPQSLIYHQHALELSEDIGDKFLIGFALSHIGLTMRRMGRHMEALAYMERSVHLRRDKLKSDHGVAESLIEISSLLAEVNRFDDAKVKVKEGLAIAEKLGETKQVSDAHKELANIYANQGDTAQALVHLQKHLAFEKEIYSEESRKRIEEFNIRMALVEKEKEKEIIKMKAEKLEQQLANFTIHLATQTEMLGNFRNEMRTIVREINEPISALKKIKEKLKELPCESVDWGKFEKEFTAVHPEFRAKLTEKYPDLTKQEIKMCQLARLGLKTYEMSRLLCLSERTIDGHRNSLRKKLGLEPNQNLKDFLQRIR